jgi:hypothetical protein
MRVKAGLVGEEILQLQDNLVDGRSLLWSSPAALEKNPHPLGEALLDNLGTRRPGRKLIHEAANDNFCVTGFFLVRKLASEKLRGCRSQQTVFRREARV